MYVLFAVSPQILENKTTKTQKKNVVCLWRPLVVGLVLSTFHLLET